jgi:hypothetical protein
MVVGLLCWGEKNHSLKLEESSQVKRGGEGLRILFALSPRDTRFERDKSSVRSTWITASNCCGRIASK